MTRRPAYTLLEVTLALAIAVMLLAALYTAVGYQLRHAQAGRELIAQATLSRNVFGRITSDIAATTGLCNPSRFRTPVNTSNSANANSSTTGSTTGGTTGATTGGTTGGATSSTGGASTAGMTSTTGATTGSTTSGTTSSTTGNTQINSTTSTTSVGTVAVTLPLGVIGDASTLHLFMSRVPAEAWGPNPGDPGALVSDLRHVVYWLASGDDGGLCRQELKVITSQDALSTDPPTGDVAASMMAPEVRSVEFSYFDGTNWNDTWDSTAIIGADGITPQGSPRAIAVKIGVPSPVKKGELKYYRHVIAISSANGTTPLTQPNPNNPAVTAAVNSTTGATGATGASGTSSTTGN